MSERQKYFKYGTVISLLFLFLFIYHNEYSNQAVKTNKAEADYLINDPSQQQHFSNVSNQSLDLLSPSNETSLDCDCVRPTNSSNITAVHHGERLPVFVPDSMPPLEPEIVDKLKLNKYSDNTVLITIAGYAMRKELYNWMKLLEYADEPNYVIFCTDLKLYMHLIVAGYEDKAVIIPDDWFMADNIDMFKDTEISMLDNHPRLSHIKTWVLQRLVYEQPFHILMLDVNEVMLHKRTVEYIQTLMHVRGDTKLIATQDSGNQTTINTGLMLLRTDSKEIKRVLANTAYIQEENHQLTQQEAFNKALNMTSLHVKTGMLVLLDILHFPNGAQFFKANLPQSKGIKPYVVHLNHKVCISPFL